MLLLGVALAAVPPGNTSSLYLRVPVADEAGDDNITLVKETVVHIQVTPPEEEELDLAGVYMHQATSGIQAILQSGSKMLLDPFVKFFQTLFSHVHPQTVPTSDRRKLYII
jgi:hypothetical protein